MRYWIDGHGRLAKVDEEWATFALENGAPELAGESIFGRPIASFSSDATTAAIWSSLFLRVRQGMSASVRIRCDSPERRRSFDLSLSLQQDGLVRVDSVLVGDVARPRVELLQHRRPQSAEVLMSCSWCKRFRADDGSWLEVEELLARERLVDAEVLPRVGHGICDECCSLYLPASRLRPGTGPEGA